MLDSKQETRWILLAEDDDEIRRLIRETLQNESDGLSLEIVEARDGVEALSKANSREFHCVLTDIRMPRASGLELIRSLQQTTLNAHTPKLVVTAAPDSELESLASHIRVVNKPFIATDLARLVVREIRLGRMDERAPVHLLNPFTQAIEDVLTEMNLTGRHDPPSVHKYGDNLIGDVHCGLVIAAAQLRHRFTLSFDIKFLQSARSLASTRGIGGGSFIPENVAKQLSQWVHEKAAPRLEKVLGAPPALAGNSICSREQTTAYNQLCNTSGINVIVNTDHGRLTAGAHSKSRPRRV